MPHWVGKLCAIAPACRAIHDPGVRADAHDVDNGQYVGNLMPRADECVAKDQVVNSAKCRKENKT